MLAAILISYVIIIGFGESDIANPARVVLLAYLVWTSARLHASRRMRRVAILAGIAAVITTLVVASFGSPVALTTVVGGLTVVFISLAISATAATLVVKWTVDTSTVLGVLCIYLMLALFFAGAHQVGAGFVSPYLNGVQGAPNASDLLYFSVITITTTGFGDITPACETARAITVAEALTGQL
jgi:hypothetical protein